MSSSYVVQASFLTFDVNNTDARVCLGVKKYNAFWHVAGRGTAWRNISLLNEEVQKVQFCDLRNTLVLFQN